MPLEKLLSPEIGLIFFQTVVMICVFFVLKRYAWGPLLAFIQKEEEGYKQAIEEKKRARAAANKLHDVSQGIIKKAEERSKRIIKTAQATKAAFLEEAKIEATAEKKRMMEEATKVIVAKEEAARRQLKDDVAVLVINTTQKLLGKSLEEKHKQEAFLSALIEEAAQEQKKSQT